MAPEGLEMLISQRRKKESEQQLHLLENRLKKLSEQEKMAKAKAES
jgi:hypothetical protein